MQHWTLISVTHNSHLPQQFASPEAAMRRAVACGFWREEFLIIPTTGNAWADYQARVQFSVRSNRQQ